MRLALSNYLVAQVVLDRGVSWEQALAKRREAAEAGMDEATNANEPMTGGTAPKVVSEYRHGCYWCNLFICIAANPCAQFANS